MQINAYIGAVIDDLYNGEILALTATLRNAHLDAPDGTSRKVSKLCGSWLEIDVTLDGDKVADAALRVQACALGQASAAILKESIEGASFDELKNARDALRDMLKADGEPPTGRFEKLKLLKGVKAYPARHTSTLLAFEAAVEALEMALSE